MTRKDYNGWTNYETWNVKLWIDNDEGSQNYWNEAAESILRRHPGSDEMGDAGDEAKRLLADKLKDEMTEQAPDLGASCWADLLNATMSEVNWCEIAESMIADAKENINA